MATMGMPEVLDVLEELPPTEEETRETLAVLGIDPDQLTARLLAEADKIEARANAAAGAVPATGAAGAPAKKGEAPRRRIGASLLAAAAAMACVAGLAFLLWPKPPLDGGAPHVKLPAEEPEGAVDAGTATDAGTEAPRHAPRRPRTPR